MANILLTENDVLRACYETANKEYINKAKAAKLLGYKHNLTKNCKFEILFNRLIREGKIFINNKHRYCFQQFDFTVHREITKERFYEACVKNYKCGEIDMWNTAGGLGFHYNDYSEWSDWLRISRKLLYILINEGKIIEVRKGGPYRINNNPQILPDNLKVQSDVPLLKSEIIKMRCDLLKDAISKAYSGYEQFGLAPNRFIDVINIVGTPIADSSPYIRKLVKDGFIEKVCNSKPAIYRLVRTDADILNNNIKDITYENMSKKIEVLKSKNKTLEAELASTKNEFNSAKIEIKNLEFLLTKAQDDAKVLRNKLYELNFKI